MEILEKIFVSGRRAFKTNKHPDPVEVNTIDTFSNIEITSMILDGEGNAIVVKINNFYVPISRLSFFEFLKTVNIKNGIIQDTCAIVGDYLSFSLLNIEDPVYIDLYSKYEILKEAKKTKYLKNDIAFGDVVTFITGKSKFEDIVYFGELFSLPFVHRRRHNQMAFIFNSQINKKFVFGKLREDNSIEMILTYSVFPIVIAKKEKENHFPSTQRAIIELEKTLVRKFVGYAPRITDFFKETLVSQYSSLNFTKNNNMILKFYVSEPTIEKAKEDVLNLFNYGYVFENEIPLDEDNSFFRERGFRYALPDMNF